MAFRIALAFAGAIGVVELIWLAYWRLVLLPRQLAELQYVEDAGKCTAAQFDKTLDIVSYLLKHRRQRRTRSINRTFSSTTLWERIAGPQAAQQQPDQVDSERAALRVAKSYCTSLLYVPSTRAPTPEEDALIERGA